MGTPKLEARFPAPILPGGAPGSPAHPDTGAAQAHVVGTAGPLPCFAWQVAAAGSLAPPAWTASTSYAADAVVTLPAGTYLIPGGNPLPSLTGQSPSAGQLVQLAVAFGFASSGGTSDVTAPKTLGPGVVDGGPGGVTWTIVPAFANGLLLTVVSGAPSIGRVNGFPVPSPGLPLPSCSRPDLIYTTSGTLAVLGLP
jgi:hypothetical protein